MGLLDDLEFIPITIASPKKILEWTGGEVVKPEHVCCTKGYQPEKVELFCEEKEK